MKMLKELRTAKNLTQGKFAKELEDRFGTPYTQADISRYEKGTIIPPDKRVRQMAEVLNVKPAILRGEENYSPSAEHKDSVKNTLQPKIAGVMPIPQFGPDVVPVLGNANGSLDAIVLNFDDPIGEITRHPNQQGMKGAFAVYARGESMSPRYMPGDAVYAISNKPPARGQDCIIEMQNGESFIKHFLKQTDKEIVCKQYNPEKEWKKPLSDVKALHAIVGRG